LRTHPIGQLRTVEVGTLKQPFEGALDPPEQTSRDLRRLANGIHQRVADTTRIGRIAIACVAVRSRRVLRYDIFLQ
jgi:hypothetical protein